MPFGFPSGPELKAAIIRRLESPGDTMNAIAKELRFSEDHITQFRDALKFSGRRSVDAFLEHRREFLDIGKVAMACELLSLEFQSAVFVPKGNNWYEYFFNKLNTRFEEFKQNNVAVVTFNYDRSLEYYLVTALENSYGKDRGVCLEMLTAIPIVHVYGHLGPLPAIAGLGRGFGVGVNGKTVRAAASGIKIIHEGETTETFERAHELLRSATRICFIGFGYDETNLDRLLEPPPNGAARVEGSALGLTEGEIQLVVNRFRNKGFPAPVLSSHPAEALDFLRDMCTFD